MLNRLKTSTMASRERPPPTPNTFETRRSKRPEAVAELRVVAHEGERACLPLPPLAFSSRRYSLSSAALWNRRPPALRSSVGTRVLASGIRMSMGTPVDRVRSGATRRPSGSSKRAGEGEAVPPVVRARPELTLQVVRIEGPAREGDLVVVRVVFRLGQGVGGQEAVSSAALLQGHQQTLVARAHARLQVQHAVGAAHHGVEDRADPPSDDEVGALVVEAVGAQEEVFEKAHLGAQVPLLDLGGLHAVVDDVDAAGARARQDEPGEGVRQ